MDRSLKMILLSGFLCLTKMNNNFDNWLIPYNDHLDKVVSHISIKMKGYYISREEIRNLCLFTMWRMQQQIQTGELHESSVDKAMYTYCWNTILTQMQKERYVKDNARQHPCKNHHEINNNDCILVKSDFTEEIGNEEIVDIAISIADNNEKPYIQSVFFDGLTIVETAKQFNVHSKTVSYHLRKFIKRIRDFLEITDTKIQLNWNVADSLSHARLGVPLKC